MVLGSIVEYCVEAKRPALVRRCGDCVQVSVLTDQVEAQGEKIRDLDMCLDENREKLNATEEMLQQVGLFGGGGGGFHTCQIP